MLSPLPSLCIQHNLLPARLFPQLQDHLRQQQRHTSKGQIQWNLPMEFVREQVMIKLRGKLANFTNFISWRVRQQRFMQILLGSLYFSLLQSISDIQIRCTRGTGQAIFFQDTVFTIFPFFSLLCDIFSGREVNFCGHEEQTSKFRFMDLHLVTSLLDP